MGGGEVLKKGWLIKSPPLEGSGLKSWRRRWFCLMSSKVLEYYKSAKHSELKGVINLEDCESLNVNLFHKKYKHVFDLRTKDRIFYLVASSSAEMDSWVEVICRICNFSHRLSATETDSLSRRNSSSLPSTTRMSTKFSPAHTRDSFRTKFISPVESSAAERDANYGIAKEAVAEVARMSEPPSQIPSGIPFTEALESKGLARRTQTSVGFSQPKPTVASQFHTRRVTSTNSPSHISSRSFQEDDDSSDDEHLYELPPDCMLSSSPISALDIPDHYDVPRSWNAATHSSAIPIGGSLASSTVGSERAHVLENGYMVPRMLLQQVQYNYDYLPSPRPANGGKPHRSALLQEVSSTETTSSSGGPPHRYINVRQFAEGNAAPPVDRSTKPSGPAVDRSLKPDRVGSEVSFSSYDVPDGETSPSEDSCSPSDFSIRSDVALVNEAFAPTDIPRLTSRSVQYIQVEFEKSRKPIPKPRSNPIKSPHAKPRVNYTDIDITATSANVEPGTPSKTRTHDSDLQGTKENTFENESDFYMEDGTDQMFISSPVHMNKVRIPMEN